MHGGLMDAFMQMFGKRPFRCRSCRKRFYSEEVKPDEPVSDDVDEPGPVQHEHPRA
jgi:hypothetical protein